MRSLVLVSLLAAGFGLAGCGSGAKQTLHYTTTPRTTISGVGVTTNGPPLGLLAEQKPEKLERAAMRWHGRLETEATFLPMGAQRICFMPTGSSRMKLRCGLARRLLHRSGSFEVMRADGSNTHTVTNPSVVSWNPVWLPHDTGIAFLSGDSVSGSGNVFVMRPAGREVHQLTHWRGPARTPQFSWSGARMLVGRA